jgi:hypothetical protein
VVNVPIALTDPPLLPEIALIMYVSCAFIPITSTRCVVVSAASVISHCSAVCPNCTVELAALSVVQFTKQERTFFGFASIVSPVIAVGAVPGSPPEPVVPPRPALPVVPPRPPPAPVVPAVDEVPAVPVVPVVPAVPAGEEVPAAPVVPVVPAADDVPAAPVVPAVDEVPAAPVEPFVPAVPVADDPSLAGAHDAAIKPINRRKKMPRDPQIKRSSMAIHLALSNMFWNFI